MNGILAAMAALSVVFAAVQGKMDAVSSAALSEGVRAVELILTLVASLCFWSGLMEVAKEGGVIRWITKLLRPVIRLLFPNAAGDPELSGILCLNLTANLLGLGNAATPLGLQAIEALSARSGCPDTATDEMVTLMLLNSCSLQLIPSTAASLRLAAGSGAPLAILFPVHASSPDSPVERRRNERRCLGDPSPDCRDLARRTFKGDGSALRLCKRGGPRT